MRGFNDFVVDYSEDVRELSGRILRNITLNRVKNNKPTVILVTGDSGEAKSYIVLAMLEELFKQQGLNLADYLEAIEIFTPYEYGIKFKKLLYDKALKDIHFVVLDEAREVVDAKKWYDFVNQAIAHINATCRTIKPMVIIVVTQFVKDIDSSVRRTLTFYGKCQRPLKRSPFLYLYRVWKDDLDLENPKLRKRRLVGYIVKGNRRIKIKPYFRFRMPSREIVQIYEKLNYEAKTKIVNRKMDILLQRLQADIKGMDKQIDAMALFYAENPETLDLIVERKRGKVTVKKEVQKMHGLTPSEAKAFEKALLNKLAEKGVAYALSKEASEHENNKKV